VGGVDGAQRGRAFCFVDAMTTTGADATEGLSALHVACIRGEDIAPLLTAESVRETETDSRGFSAIHFAARCGHTEQVQRLLEFDATLSLCRDGMGWAALSRACEAGKDDIVEILLRHDPSLVNDRDASQATPLHRAAAAGHASTCALLIRFHAELNAVEGRKRETPLHVAAAHGHDQCVQVLLEAGANANAVDASLSTPLHEAASSPVHSEAQGAFRVVELLVEHGAVVDAPDSNGDTALVLAIKARNLNVLRSLLAADADVDVPFRSGVSCCAFVLLFAVLAWQAGGLTREPALAVLKTTM